ncbi:MAG TPA: sulfotransferase [Solirubrobacterales bacterium]|jgi:hypothetical protein|nr:sulfotransferase [Solirubrobacterales bacterium]
MKVQAAIGEKRAGSLLGPDFFIVGAPKCGTTAMAAYLGQHPEIGMCPRKESHVFAADLKQRMTVKRNDGPMSKERFLDLFADLQEEPIRGEASVWHLYSEAAPAEIMAFQPEARIIVMLRNPIEMLPSLHSQFVFVGIEPVEDFGTALALDEERERSGVPRGFPPRSYRSAVRYAEQVKRYLDVFGRERVHVILYDDFRDDTLEAYRGACEFLGVDPEFEPQVEIVNPNKEVRSRILQTFVKTPPEWARPLLHRLTTENQRRRTGDALTRVNTRFRRRDPISDPLRTSLVPEAERQVRELDELLGLDVSRWVD